MVCWGGHSIGSDEYEYTKKVGYELGLRGLDVCTGCGPGAMKGPMKGATIGHAKQRIRDGRYIGLTEPGIIAAEPPNPIVNQLVIMPDIEKRLEAFVRLRARHRRVPGRRRHGRGDPVPARHPAATRPTPTSRCRWCSPGRASAAEYFEQIDHFIGATLGEAAHEALQDHHRRSGRRRRAKCCAASKRCASSARAKSDSYNFNWLLKIPPEFQQPFEATHEAMARCELHRDQPAHVLAANLRRAFSGIVAGNVKENGMRAIEERGPFELHGDRSMMKLLDELLTAFVAQKRMKLAGEYRPCYRLVA